MCQVDEDYHEPLQRAQVPGVSKKCVKCKEATAAVVIRAGDAFCRSCFKEYFIHKFRAMLGKNRVLFPGEKVLLAVSGGPSSCSMLGQVQEGLRQNAHKKLRFSPGIVFIDEGGAVGQSLEDRRRTAAELRAVFKATGFPFLVVPLEQVLDLPSSVVVAAAAPAPSERTVGVYKKAVGHFIQSDGVESQTPPEWEEAPAADVPESRTQLLQQLIGSAKTLTAREDLLNTLRQHLLVHTARTEGYSKVMLGDSCTRLAVKLLTSISLGRGAQLAQDTGFSDSRYGDVVLVRPMRDYSAKEIAYYNRMFSVPSVFIPGLDTKTSNKSSIQRLTESFVIKLQADFPSTVSAIYRTSEKLQAPCTGASAADRCLLCMCVLDTAAENASAFKATLISEQLSQNKSPGAAGAAIPRPNPAPLEPDSPAAPGQRCSSGGGEDCGKAASGVGCCSSASSREPESGDLRRLLCYSCQLTIRDMSSVERLPLYILSEAQRRSHMREEIGEFLLDEDDEGDQRRK
ncbi:cytoplasmic tRNA 2-thiolation protein 2 isoform X2 [Pseudoliparis swirei]|uniref:cytoplasmic tRNA 2-thiolation protein 2 isoform X2 n=1 Tax=Pseudoliparis swirei TaxID=2059687 RepID=UPI0024BEF06B|nr:cytoplasmic tRNA 2-thiolation protein 2 isoform X2 [Pseudoliparis swirei]